MSASGLPRVDVIANALDPERPHGARVDAARQAIGEARARVLGGLALPSHEAIIAAAQRWLEARARPSLQKVLNATGVVVHTNLGRAPLPLEAVLNALGYCNLEYDLDAGRRGSRGALIEPLLCELAGAEAALVVNNCAAALVLALASLARPSAAGAGAAVQAASGLPEVIVSRGELVEIGGSFRIPDILESAGIALREVGTTNRTYASDFERAIGPRTVAILRVHPSNFRLSGFVARPTLAELRAVAEAAALPLLVDLGSDALHAPTAAMLAEPGHDTLATALDAGADVVMLSGDKLLGGPQAGLVLGREAFIERMARHPLMRALRPDKLALGALEYVLRARASGHSDTVPVLHMLSLGPADLRPRAERLAAELAGAGVDALVIETADPIGGGSHPETTLPGVGLALVPPASLGLDGWHAALRRGRPPVIATLAHGHLVIALRTVAQADEPMLVHALVTSLDTPATLI